MAAILIHRHRLSIEQIRRLTRYQVQHLYIRQHNDKGELILPSLEREDAPVSQSDTWRAVLRLRGWPEHRIEIRLKELEVKGKDKAKPKPKVKLQRRRRP